jgi:hypothetical protein
MGSESDYGCLPLAARNSFKTTVGNGTEAVPYSGFETAA